MFCLPPPSIPVPCTRYFAWRVHPRQERCDTPSCYAGYLYAAEGPALSGLGMNAASPAGEHLVC